MKYEWEMWPAQHLPVCQGRCIMSRDFGVWGCNIVLTLLNSIMFWVFVGPSIHVVTNVILAVFVVFALYCLFRTTLTEPGIIPRKTRAEFEAEYRTPPTITLADGKQQPLKVCATCNIYRPPGASHCRDCDVCVKAFDHHCPWTNACIGERNYRYFVGFVWSITAAVTFAGACCLGLIINAAVGSNFASAVTSHPVAAVELLFLFLIGWCLCGLTGFHCYAVATDLTTKEILKGVDPRFHSAAAAAKEDQQQEETMSANCHKNLCGAMVPSLINLRALRDPSRIPPPSIPSSSPSPSLLPVAAAASPMAVVVQSEEPVVIEQQQEEEKEREHKSFAAGAAAAATLSAAADHHSSIFSSSTSSSSHTVVRVAPK